MWGGVAWGEESVDEGVEVGIVDAADAEERAEVDRREDSVEDVGEFKAVCLIGGPIEHRLDLAASAAEVLDTVGIWAVVELAGADHSSQKRETIGLANAVGDAPCVREDVAAQRPGVWDR